MKSQKSKFSATTCCWLLTIFMWLWFFKSMIFFELKKLIFLLFSYIFMNSLWMSHAHISLNKSGTCFFYKLFTSIFTLQIFWRLVCVSSELRIDNVDFTEKWKKDDYFSKTPPLLLLLLQWIKEKSGNKAMFT